MRFDGFYGNEAVKKLMRETIENGMLPHAVLIEGPQGCGKSSFARLIAEACVCSADDEKKPCGECSHCVKSKSLNHPDIITYSSGKTARSFNVKTVREIRADAYITPNEAEKKVYILTDIQNMTEQAQNALLKVLEEPPRYVVFLLTCTSRVNLLETICSRCRIISLSPVSTEDAVRALTEQLHGESPEKIKTAAAMANGNIGRAKSILNGGVLESAADITTKTGNALCASKEYDLLKISGMLEKNNELLTALTDMLIVFFGDAVNIKCKNLYSEKLSEKYNTAAYKTAEKFTLKQIYSMLSVCVKAREQIDKNVNRTLLGTWLFSSLWKIRANNYINNG